MLGSLGWSAYASVLLARKNLASAANPRLRSAKVVQNQGFDIFGLNDNLLLKGAEYSAEYNLGNTVTYDPSWYRCEAVLVNGPWSQIAEYGRGITSDYPIWNLYYYEYVVKRGLEATWTAQARDEEGFEGLYTGGPTRDEHPSWGGLIWAVET